MAHRTDRPDLEDLDGTGEGLDRVGRDDGSARARPSAARYKQVRRRAGDEPGSTTAPEGMAETNRMKRTRRSSTTARTTASPRSGHTGSTGTEKVAAGKAQAGNAATVKTGSGKPAAGKPAAGKAASSRTAAGKTASGKVRSVDPEAVDPKATDTEGRGSGATSKATGIPAGRSDVSTKWAVDRLDPRERRISFAAAGAAVLFGITIYISESHDKKFHLAKNQLTPEWTLILGVSGGALLLGATLLGRRAPVGFVALFAGAMFTGSSIIFGLPFIAVALWILYRSYKVQKEMSASVRAARAESRAQGPRATGASARGSATSTRGAKSAAKTKGPAMPEANKRFTPKRPPPPPPKPSRRERKAAQASD